MIRLLDLCNLEISILGQSPFSQNMARTSLVVQLLRTHTSTVGLIPGSGKVPHAKVQQKKKKGQNVLYSPVSILASDTQTCLLKLERDGKRLAYTSLQ